MPSLPPPARAIVLNVDDSEANRYWRSRVLGRADVEVIDAASAAEALSLAASVRPAVVVLDVNLPDMKGLEVCRRLKEGVPPTPLVLLVSAVSVDAPARIAGLEAGADGYLVLPTDAGELLAQVRAMLRLHAAEQAAQHANRLKDEFLATLSHELRTPLNAILGWTSLLQSGALDSAGQRRALDTIERNARAQARLIADILDISAIAAGKLSLQRQPVRIGTVIDHVVETIRPVATGRTLKIAVDPAHAAALVHADASRLQQVIWNLLSNAVKFTAPGGRVEVGVEADAADVRVFVKDDGVGIPPEFLPHLFNRFRQADGSTTRAHTGMGLGLAIAKDLVQMHGGAIDAASEGQGRGATFTVRLPRAHAAAPAPPPDVPDLGVPGWSVLVVDDHADTREMMALVLRDRGIEVTTAASSEEAVEAFRGAPKDVALIDISMPDEDGYTCLRRLREISREAGHAFAAIAVTANARAQDRAEALSAGFAAHVPKPVDVDRLLGILHRTGGQRATPAGSDA